MKPKLRRILLSVVLVAALVLVVLASVSDSTDRQPAPARFDPASATCVGGDATSRQECESQIEAVQTALRNASIAQESYRTAGGGYTEQTADLEVEGLRLPAGVSLRVAEVRPDGYCLEAADDSGVMIFHLDSDDDAALPGACRLGQ